MFSLLEGVYEHLCELDYHEFNSLEFTYIFLISHIELYDFEGLHGFLLNQGKAFLVFSTIHFRQLIKFVHVYGIIV